MKSVESIEKTTEIKLDYGKNKIKKKTQTNIRLDGKYMELYEVKK